MSVGGILGESWRLYTRFFRQFFLIAIVVYLAVNLLNALIGSLLGHSAGIAALVALITLVISIVGTFWLQGALVYAVIDVRDGTIDTRVRQVFERIQPLLGTLIAAGLLAGLGIAI